MKLSKLIVGFLTIGACQSNMNKKEIHLQSLPESKQDSTQDTYFGKQISDPYRWLENDTAPEVMQWVKNQNDATANYLAQIDNREALKKRLTEIWNFAKYSAPTKEGDY